MPRFTRLFEGLSSHRIRFDPRSGHVGYLIDKVALRQFFFLPVLRIFFVSIIPPVLQTQFHSLIIFAVESILRQNTSLSSVFWNLLTYTSLSNEHVIVCAVWLVYEYCLSSSTRRRGTLVLYVKKLEQIQRKCVVVCQNRFFFHGHVT